MTVSPPLPDFADGKAPDAMRTIGEVSAAFDIKQHILRYWEQQFPMLDPLKRSGGRRYYRPADVELVAQIDRLVNREGYTIKGARKALELKAGQQDGTPIVAAQADDRRPESGGSEDVLAKLRNLRQRLAEALEAA